MRRFFVGLNNPEGDAITHHLNSSSQRLAPPRASTIHDLVLASNQIPLPMGQSPRSFQDSVTDVRKTPEPQKAETKITVKPPLRHVLADGASKHHACVLLTVNYGFRQ
jgi:hypothetical protein